MSTLNTVISNLETLSAKMREEILVVPRHKLFAQDLPWHGLKKADFDMYLHRIKHHQEFHPRGFMEEDFSYKQIIPYLVFTHEGTYFLMQRRANASEQRLAGKMSLGIGGHIRASDIGDGDIFSWAKREFHEEVRYSGKLRVEPLGILNDDTNDVGKVHIGFVFLLHGDNANISIKSELQEGYLASLEECIEKKDFMEGWSQFVVDALER